MPRRRAGAPKRLCVEPVLGPLRTEMGHEKFYLALQNFGLEGNIAIGLSEVAVPFRDLIFEDEMISIRG